MLNCPLVTALLALSLAIFSPMANAKMPKISHKTTQVSKTTFTDGVLSIYFKPNNATLPPDFASKVQPIIDAGKEGKIIGISSYSRSTDNAVLNAKISKNRAMVVEQFLHDNFIPFAQIKMIKPADTVITDSNRVDVTIIDDE